MSSTSNSNAAGHQQQEYEESSTTTTATTTPSDEEMELIEEEWEFNAPKYFDFDRLSKLALSNNQHHHHEEELNHSNADQWFFTPDAQHLEFLDPKYIDLNNQADSHPQQQQSNNNNPMMMMNNYETLNDISTISKYSVHQESLGSTTSHQQQQQYQLHHHQYINNNNTTTNNNTIGTINAFNAIRMTPIKKIKKKVMAKLTIPQTPNFKTDKRIRQRKNETNNNLNNNNTTSTTHNTHIVKTVKAIHSSSDSNNNTTTNNNITRFKTISKPTTPKPFKFRTDSRVLDTDRTTAQIPSNHSPFNKSILQKINDMKSKVPSRWKQKPDIVTPHKPMKITKPNSFKLRTKFRSRINNNNTNMNAPPVPPTFKARPLNRKIFESHGELGLSKIIKKEITHPQEFNLMTEERSKKRKFDQSKLLDDTLSTSSMQQHSTIIGGNSENHYNRPLKSRKLDQTSSHSHHSTLGGNSYLVQSTKIEKTIPQSPKLRTKSRATNRSILHEATPNSPHITFRARPLPQSNPFVPIINHTITVPEPFSLSTESRGIIHKKQFNVDEKIPTITFKARPIHHYTNIDTSKITHKPVTVPVSPNITKVKSKKDDSILVSASIGPKLQHYFKARPMPDFNTSSLNKTKNLEMPHVTKSAPFNLETEKRGQAYQSKFKASIQSMERVSISKIDDGTFTSITKRVFNTSIQQLR